ncbi:MAG: DMT family transporter [Acholeplasmataceae bacterium]|nr:DMT family transporter [Acholeplasmataceae bacterium]
MNERKYVLFAILAAAFYALSTPISKFLLNKQISPTMLAGLLYIGAGLGMFFVRLFKNKSALSKEALTKAQLPYILAMVVLDILAPIFLMLGLQLSTPGNVSLLNNFEIVATSIIALVIFKERITIRTWIGIMLISIASVILSISDLTSFTFSLGSLYILLACIFWGFENNCTKKLSNNDPLEIVTIKGIFSGIGSLLVATILGELTFNWKLISIALCLGFIAYGFSVLLYVRAQIGLGAAKTSAYYAVAPFISVLLSLVIFWELPDPTFYIALVIMIVGAYFVTAKINKDNKNPLIKS